MMEDNEILKNYLHTKNYTECVKLLKNKIVNFVLTQIQKIDMSVDYTTVSDLIAISDFYLNDSTIARKLEIALRDDNNVDKINKLLIICKAHQIS